MQLCQEKESGECSQDHGEAETNTGRRNLAVTIDRLVPGSTGLALSLAQYRLAGNWRHTGGTTQKYLLSRLIVPFISNTVKQVNISIKSYNKSLWH